MPHLLGDADQLLAVILLQLLDCILVNGIHHEQHLQKEGKSVSVGKLSRAHAQALEGYEVQVGQVQTRQWRHSCIG